MQWRWQWLRLLNATANRDLAVPGLSIIPLDGGQLKKHGWADRSVDAKLPDHREMTVVPVLESGSAQR